MSNDPHATAEEQVGHVRRYTFAPQNAKRDGDLVMLEATDGPWVMYSDLVHEIERLELDKRALADTAAAALNEKQSLKVELINLRARAR